MDGILERSRTLPLRLLAAPAGAGKTCAVAHYLATCERRAAYLALKRDETPEGLRERLASALALPYVPASFAALVAALATLAPLELAIDDCDRGTSETREELVALVEEAPEGISLIYCARDRTSIDRGRLLARGLATIVDAQSLAFDDDDVARVIEAHALPPSPAEASRVLAETEGWPLAATWILRDAAAHGALEGAFERWCAASARHLAAFVDDAAAEAGADAAAALATVVREGERDRGILAGLEAKGLFVRYADEEYRLYRVLERLDVARPAAPVAAAPSLLSIRMFGRFEAKIDGAPIAWIRRREAQLFKYLLLKPGGSATRAELCDVFWPGTNAHAATQSLRTACSNIRKAIAQLVGYGEVERYFTTGGDIAVPLEHAVIDVRRFIAHVTDGDADLESGRVQEAFAHFRAAEQLYVGELLSGDYPEPWYAPRAEMFKSLFRGVLERIAELHRDAGRARQAADYLQRSRELASGPAGFDGSPLQPAPAV